MSFAECGVNIQQQAGLDLLRLGVGSHANTCSPICNVRQRVTLALKSIMKRTKNQSSDDNKVHVFCIEFENFTNRPECKNLLID